MAGPAVPPQDARSPVSCGTQFPETRESAKGGLALGGYTYETQILQILAMRFPTAYRNPVLSVGFRYRYFLA
eukprot:COSAG02_NODE_9546_length_2183_cov_3.826775_4_plen_71_part_01